MFLEYRWFQYISLLHSKPRNAITLRSLSSKFTALESLYQVPRFAASSHSQPLPRIAKDALGGVLDKATKARQKSIQLQGLEFADALAQEMLKHANDMEAIYIKLKKAIEKDPPDEENIETIINDIEQKKKWYEKAEVGVLVETSKMLFVLFD